MRNRRLALAGPVVAACALAASGCAGGGQATATARQSPSSETPHRPTALTASAPRVARAPSGTGRSAGLARPRTGYPVLFVRRHRRVPLWTARGGGQLVGDVGDRTSFGSPTVFSVVRWSRGWAAVDTPYLPNGQLGWVRLEPRRLGVFSTPWAIVVHLSTREAELMRGDRVVRTFSVDVGAPDSPTPMGRFAVTDTFRGDGLDSAAYGCCALALAAHQPLIPSGWLGGSRIAIHGTYGPIGYAISHGCIRASNADVAALVRDVPIGSPVVVVG